MARIVVPLDESELAEQALPWAAYLARAFSSSLHLVSVWTHDEEFWQRAGLDAGATNERIAAAIDEYLCGVAARPDFDGLAVTTEVRMGSVPEHIREVASDGDTVYVVLTSHGRSGLRRFIQGSVADALVRTLSLPVFVVRPAATVPPLRRLLLTLDGSRTAEHALQAARGLAAATGAELHLVRVSNPLSELPYTALGPVPDLGELARELTDAAREYLEATAHEGEVCEVLAGRPLDAIIEYARGHGCEVIAMGTHGRGGILRLALGSTADAVMRAADRPVLLVPDRPAS